jgi:hypothetical protein
MLRQFIPGQSSYASRYDAVEILMLAAGVLVVVVIAFVF